MVDKFDVKAILTNVTGFVDGNPRQVEAKFNDLWHWFKHAFGGNADLHGVMTVDAYLKAAKEFAAQAAKPNSGILLKLRDNNEIILFWAPRPESRGLFMTVRPSGPRSGQIKTFFSPDGGKVYYDHQEPVDPTFH